MCISSIFQPTTTTRDQNFLDKHSNTIKFAASMSILKREILYPGKADIGELELDTKLIYHFETLVIQKNGSEPVMIDDSRQIAKGEPVETIYGKQFKLPIWESCLSAMRKNEICRITVRDDPITHYIALNYVLASKCFRKYYKVKPDRDATGDNHHHEDDENETHHHHQCSMSLQHSSPYKDLNKLMIDPPEIFVFTFELVDVIPPESYTKEIWQMSDTEKISILPKYREDGNRNFAECNFELAASAYSRGLGIIESLLLKEKPGDVDFLRLENMKVPFLLNLAQVKLNQGEYYDCIKCTDEVLKKDPENIKALFRRAKAQAGVWNLNDARKDFKKCVEYNRNMAKTVSKCIQELNTKEMLRDKEDRERFGRMFI